MLEKLYIVVADSSRNAAIAQARKSSAMPSDTSRARSPRGTTVLQPQPLERAPPVARANMTRARETFSGTRTDMGRSAADSTRPSTAQELS